MQSKSKRSLIATATVALLNVIALTAPAQHGPVQDMRWSADRMDDRSAPNVVAQYNPCPSGNCRR